MGLVNQSLNCHVLDVAAARDSPLSLNLLTHQKYLKNIIATRLPSILISSSSTLWYFKKEIKNLSIVTNISRNFYGRWNICFSENVCISSSWNRVAYVFPHFVYFVSNADIGKQLHCLWHDFETYFKCDPCRGW